VQLDMNKTKTCDGELLASAPIPQSRRFENPRLHFERSSSVDVHTELPDIFGLTICKNLKACVSRGRCGARRHVRSDHS